MALSAWQQSVGTMVLWVAVLLRAPFVFRSPQQRGLWLAVATAVIAMTLNLPSVSAATTDLLGRGHAVGLVRNLFGVVSAAAVLYFVAETTARRRLRRWHQRGTCTLLAALIVIDAVNEEPHDYVVTGAGDSPLLALYWLLLIAAHLGTNVLCVIMCWRYARGGASLSLIWSLRLFGIGTALAGLFWVGHLMRLFFPVGWIAECQPLIMEAHGLFRAAAILVPAVRAAHCICVDISIVWRLWPLWKELTEAVPAVTLTKSRPRLFEILWPPVPWKMFAYRKVIETRDAILVLHNYIDPALLEEARDHVSTLGIPEAQRDAAVLACALHRARRMKPVGGPSKAKAVPVSPARLDHGDFASEVLFLLDVRQAYELVARA
ncbi:MAB_1171c family putative transporter [Streptomyces sp. NPDC007991]|uniref:MAB_1171c family putative transporter n=1 Tax=Streptomyces sp. NPDC007991 TaxID=3364803 RepID=UPI0036E68536